MLVYIVSNLLRGCTIYISCNDSVGHNKIFITSKKKSVKQCQVKKIPNNTLSKNVDPAQSITHPAERERSTIILVEELFTAASLEILASLYL